MVSDIIIGEFNSLLKDYLTSLNFILVDIICRYEGNGLVLRVLADKPNGGINLDECAMLNREIGVLLDEKDIIKEKYILEVASPGLDRPLKTRDDFLRLLNKPAKFFLNEVINGKLEWDGSIDRVDQESVFIMAKEGIIELPIIKINKAKLII
ncbi:MAG TPA: ribosome maturation factor RimP [Candidatus Omnitrophota bacterium]|nr:ribosome maturation factor RimP [Candidatus Omnitrophota bacterium]